MMITYDHRLEDWQDPANPVVGPAPGPASAVSLWVPHYEGLGSGRHTNWNVMQGLRNKQHWWTHRPTNRFSLGYNDALVSIPDHPMDGHLIEIRGQRFRGAATGGINLICHATLVLQTQGHRMTPKAVERAKALSLELREAYPAITGPDRIQDHGRSPSTTATSCAGSGIRQDVDAGILWGTLDEVAPPLIGRDLDVKPYQGKNKRLLDTRILGSRVAAGQTVFVDMPVGLEANAVWVNVAMLDAAGPGFITVWGSGPRPNDSVQQTWLPGQMITGSTYVPIGFDGKIRVYSSGSCHLLVDLVATGT